MRQTHQKTGKVELIYDQNKIIRCFKTKKNRINYKTKDIDISQKQLQRNNVFNLKLHLFLNITSTLILQCI